MVFRVKNTTFFRDFSVFDVLCIEKCRGCGDRGGFLCERCKKYIFEHYKNHCPVCKREVRGGVCRECLGEACRKGSEVCWEESRERGEVSEREKGKEVYGVFSGLFSVGFRDEIIGEMVEEYKYYSVRGLSRVLGEILEKTAIRELRREVKGYKNIVVIPLPTSRKHIRERGFDHTELILRKTGGVRVLRLLIRAKDTTQVGASEKKRLAQAKEAYNLNPKYFEKEAEGEFRIREKYRGILGGPVVLFDDIWTTGASMTEAAKILKRMGFLRIYGVVLGTNRKGRKPEIRRGEV